MTYRTVRNDEFVSNRFLRFANEAYAYTDTNRDTYTDTYTDTNTDAHTDTNTDTSSHFDDSHIGQGDDATRCISPKNDATMISSGDAMFLD